MIHRPIELFAIDRLSFKSAQRGCSPRSKLATRRCKFMFAAFIASATLMRFGGVLFTDAHADPALPCSGLLQGEWKRRPGYNEYLGRLTTSGSRDQEMAIEDRNPATGFSLPTSGARHTEASGPPPRERHPLLSDDDDQDRTLEDLLDERKDLPIRDPFGIYAMALHANHESVVLTDLLLDVIDAFCDDPRVDALTRCVFMRVHALTEHVIHPALLLHGEPGDERLERKMSEVFSSRH